jgi:hypothetical protein
MTDMEFHVDSYFLPQNTYRKLDFMGKKKFKISGRSSAIWPYHSPLAQQQQQQFDVFRCHFVVCWRIYSFLGSKYSYKQAAVSHAICKGPGVPGAKVCMQGRFF